MTKPTFGCVVLTHGQRPDLLSRAIDSLRQQEGVDTDIVVVGNAWKPTGLPDGVRSLWLKEDVGIPAGRNAGVPHVHGDLLFFLDYDASLAEMDTLLKLARLFEAMRDVALVQPRIEPLEGGVGPRDWVPRLRAASRGRSGDVTVSWEGALAMRRNVFDEIGGWEAELRVIHEGVDLAWRTMDAGHRVYYAADLVARHPMPVDTPARHDYSRYFGARNRVWVARRHLPLPLGVLYVATFAARTVPLLLRAPRDIRPTLRGYRDGIRQPRGGQRKLRLRTLLRMTRAGRPPVI